MMESRASPVPEAAGSVVFSPTEQCPSGRCSMSPSKSRAFQRQENRRAAARFIAAVTGVEVPAGDDDEFRRALADGVIVCRVLNAIQPETIPKVIETGAESETGEIIQTFENVSNFIKAASRITQETFSTADLCSPDGGDRIIQCLLALQDWAQNRNGMLLDQRRFSRSPTIMVPSPSGALSPPTSGGRAAGGTPTNFSFTPHAQHVVAKHGTSNTADGVSYLMRSCNFMMKSHMGMPTTPLPPVPKGSGITSSEIALDAVGPVLETVIQNLTTEYEKRLLSKDQEFKHVAEERARMRRPISTLQQEGLAGQMQAEEAAAAAAPAGGGEMSAAQQAEYERLLEAQAAVEVELARREEEMAVMEAQYQEQAEMAEAELGRLREEVQRKRDLDARYTLIAEENRFLYNTVQDLRGNIRVFCRVRPRGATGDGSTGVVEVEEDQLVNVFSHKHNKWHQYKFDRVFGEESTQDDVYEETKPLIRSVLDGYNVCIFAYGQTGSGKTHTMSGSNVDAYSDRGINYRALDDLFQLNRERHAEVEYDIKVQLLEIYNESLRDLLVSEAEARQQRSLALQNTQRSGSNVPDATQVTVSYTEEVLRVMALGARNRAVAETRMNERSSRSHQVLTVLVDGVNKITHARTHGCLHLIDLAGSERVAKSGAQGQQLLEAQHINKSLSSLGSVMHALASKSPHVPFRDSKLTQLLQDSLSGQAKSMMFMHIAPEMSSASETLSTLNFGKGVTEITLGAAKKNKESGTLIEARDRLRKVELEASAARAALEAEQQRSEALQQNSELEASAARAALEAEQQRSEVLQAEVETLRHQLARAAAASTAQSSPAASDCDEPSIHAYRPAPAAVRLGAPPHADSAGGGSTVTPKPQLPLRSVDGGAPGSGMTPRGGRVLTPRGSGGASGGCTPRGSGSLSRPPQVSRLNISSGVLAGRPSLGEPGGAAASMGRPPISKLNLGKLQSDSQENKTPGSLRLSKIPGPSPPGALGSITARPGVSRSPSFSTGVHRTGSMSARESPAEAAVRKAAAGMVDRSGLRPAAGGGSLNPARRSMPGADAGRVLVASMLQRTTSGESSNSGALNSARGVRSSIAATSRRWQ